MLGAENRSGFASPVLQFHCPLVSGCVRCTCNQEPFSVHESCCFTDASSTLHAPEHVYSLEEYLFLLLTSHFGGLFLAMNLVLVGLWNLSNSAALMLYLRSPPPLHSPSLCSFRSFSQRVRRSGAIVSSSVLGGALAPKSPRSREEGGSELSSRERFWT